MRTRKDINNYLGHLGWSKAARPLKLELELSWTLWGFGDWTFGDGSSGTKDQIPDHHLVDIEIRSPQM